MGFIPAVRDQHPNTSMFIRAGGVTPKKKGTASNTLSDAITQLSSALSPKSVAITASSSPAKVIDNRCYKQLSELKNLLQSGVLSEEECRTEREAIMSTLNKL